MRSREGQILRASRQGRQQPGVERIFSSRVLNLLLPATLHTDPKSINLPRLCRSTMMFTSLRSRCTSRSSDRKSSAMQTSSSTFILRVQDRRHSPRLLGQNSRKISPLEKGSCPSVLQKYLATQGQTRLRMYFRKLHSFSREALPSPQAVWIPILRTRLQLVLTASLPSATTPSSATPPQMLACGTQLQMPWMISAYPPVPISSSLPRSLILMEVRISQDPFFFRCEMSCSSVSTSNRNSPCAEHSRCQNCAFPARWAWMWGLLAKRKSVQAAMGARRVGQGSEELPTRCLRCASKQCCRKRMFSAS